MIHSKFVLVINPFSDFKVSFTFKNIKILHGSNIWNVPLACAQNQNIHTDGKLFIYYLFMGVYKVSVDNELHDKEDKCICSHCLKQHWIICHSAICFISVLLLFSRFLNKTFSRYNSSIT